MPINPHERYAMLVATFLNTPNVTHSEKRGFGSGLRLNGKVFAMLVKSKLVVKLPRQRVADLIASGGGAPFYSSNGRVMKEWVAIEPALDERWLPLAQEALEFAKANSVVEASESD